MAKPTSSKKSGMDPKLTTLIDEIVTQAKDESKDRKTNKQVKWLMPPKGGWSGDIFKWNEMDKPFDSKKSNEDLKKTIKSASSPGNVGDLINTATQLEYLAMAERAFRARHTMTFSRNIAHATARKYGQSRDTGPFKFTVENYLKDLQKMSSGQLDQGQA